MSDDCGCGCGGCDDNLIAEEMSKDVFDNPGEAMRRSKELGCDKVHTMRRDGKTLFMPCGTHDEYDRKMSEEADYDDDEDDDEDKKKGKDDDEEEYDASASCESGYCPPGFEFVAGECITVTCDLDIQSVEVIAEANTGINVVRISGVAFTDGYNKNGWRLTKAAAQNTVEQMVGADLTLNHPKQKGVGFSRNMDGGVDEAVVGIVTEAKMKMDDMDDEKYNVRFTGEVYREELFAALESGLWLREGYGVSIGGTGIPTATEEDEKGRRRMTFGGEFSFDHLAIVHKPAYADAKIDKVEKVELEMPSASTLIYQTGDGSTQPKGEYNMSDEIEMVEASEANDDLAAIQEQLVLANARIAEFEAKAMEAAESERVALVEKASELGLSGHDDFTTEMLERVISSWEASRPEPREMAPATPAAPEAVIEASEEVSDNRSVVANYLNGELVESSQDLYSRAWNAWASAWNGTISGGDERAPMFDEIKDKV